jgi:hypothetical protein
MEQVLGPMDALDQTLQRIGASFCWNGPTVQYQNESTAMTFMEGSALSPQAAIHPRYFTTSDDRLR